MKINREEIVKALREQVSNMDYSLYAKFLDGVFQAQATAILKLIEGESRREEIEKFLKRLEEKETERLKRIRELRAEKKNDTCPEIQYRSGESAILNETIFTLRRILYGTAKLQPAQPEGEREEKPEYPKSCKHCGMLVYRKEDEDGCFVNAYADHNTEKPEERKALCKHCDDTGMLNGIERCICVRNWDR